MGCDREESQLELVFNKSELVTIEKIISYYDEFVVSNSEIKHPIDIAYSEFLNERCQKAIMFNNLNFLLPENKGKFKFYDTLDSITFKEIFNIRDSINYTNGVTIYSPYTLSINYNGKYMDLLELLAQKNDFFNNYYQAIISTGDIGPYNYAVVLEEYDNLDFTKKEERLVLIINLLHASILDYNFEENVP